MKWSFFFLANDGIKQKIGVDIWRKKRTCWCKWLLRAGSGAGITRLPRARAWNCLEKKILARNCSLKSHFYAPTLHSYTLSKAPPVQRMKLPRALRGSQLTFYAPRVAAFSARYRHRAKSAVPIKRQQIIVLAYRTVDRWRPWGDSSGCHIKGLPAMGMVTSTYTATILLLPTFFLQILNLSLLHPKSAEWLLQLNYMYVTLIPIKSLMRIMSTLKNV